MGRRVSIHLPDSLIRELDKRARHRKCRRSDIIREALMVITRWPDGFFEHRPIDRVRDLIGSVKNLPPDLASNPQKYMRDFGRDRL